MAFELIIIIRKLCNPKWFFHHGYFKLVSTKFSFICMNMLNKNTTALLTYMYSFTVQVHVPSVLL